MVVCLGQPCGWLVTDPRCTPSLAGPPGDPVRRICGFEADWLTNPPLPEHLLMFAPRINKRMNIRGCKGRKRHWQDIGAYCTSSFSQTAQSVMCRLQQSPADWPVSAEEAVLPQVPPRPFQQKKNESECLCFQVQGLYNNTPPKCRISVVKRTILVLTVRVYTLACYQNSCFSVSLTSTWRQRCGAATCEKLFCR